MKNMEFYPFQGKSGKFGGGGEHIILGLSRKPKDNMGGGLYPPA
jgi:hypothetical protein